MLLRIWGLIFECMVVELFNAEKRKRRKLCYYLFPQYRTQGRKDLGRVGNLDSRKLPAHLPLAIFKLNRKHHDFNQVIFSVESQVAHRSSQTKGRMVERPEDSA